MLIGEYVSNSASATQLSFEQTFARATDVVLAADLRVGTNVQYEETPNQVNRFKRGASTHIWIWDFIEAPTVGGFTGRHKATVRAPAKVGVLFFVEDHTKRVGSEWELRIYGGGDYARRFEMLRQQLERQFGVTVIVNPTLALPIF